jgi:hypothetical protein
MALPPPSSGWRHRVGQNDRPRSTGKHRPIDKNAPRDRRRRHRSDGESVPPPTMSFWIEMWENDWATRCGSYNLRHRSIWAGILDWLRFTEIYYDFEIGSA